MHKVECVIPWLNDALVYFTVSLQLCQQLKDKVCRAPGAGKAVQEPRHASVPPSCKAHWQQFPDMSPFCNLDITSGFWGV